MSQVKAPLRLRALNSIRGVGIVLKHPTYILLALLISFIISGFIIWSLNFDLVKYIVVEAPIDLSEKLRFFWDVQTGIYSAYDSAQATGILLFGALFGLNASLVTYLVRLGGFRQVPKKSGGASLMFAVLGGGCIACGTSILAPILATLGATSSAFSSSLSNYLNWVGIILITYSLYSLGTVINNLRNINQ